MELYARLLREDSQKRQLRDLGQQLLDSPDDASEMLIDATDRLRKIENGSITSDVAGPDDACRAFMEHRKRVESREGAVPTGFAPLEMSLEQIEGKRIARISGVPSDKILLSDGKDMDYHKVLTAAKELKNLPLHISRRPSATVAQIRRMAKQVDGLQCLVVDYLGKITPSSSKASRYEATTAISNDLKTLAVELGIPVLCLAQLHRENTGRNDKRPQLSDLRDSGAIEQDADGVIMLHREDYYSAEEEPLKPWESVELEIIVRKNRHGRSFGVYKAGFFPATEKIVRGA